MNRTKWNRTCEFPSANQRENGKLQKGKPGQINSGDAEKAWSAAEIRDSPVWPAHRRTFTIFQLRPVSRLASPSSYDDGKTAPSHVAHDTVALCCF